MEKEILIFSILCVCLHIIGIFYFFAKKNQQDASFFAFIGTLMALFALFFAPEELTFLALIIVFLGIGIFAEMEFENYKNSYILSIIVSVIVMLIVLIYPLL